MVSGPRPEPQRIQVREPVTGSGTQVSIQRHGGLAAERQGPFPPALADHPHHVVLEVEIAQAHAEQFRAARPGIHQDHQHRGVAASLEVLAGADGEQAAELRLAKDWDGPVGTAGGFIFAIGLGRYSSSSSQR